MMFTNRNSISNYIVLEFLLIVRNKKPLNNLYQILVLYISSIFLYSYSANSGLDNSFLHYLTLNLMGCSFLLGHGIYLLTWESTYFAFLMSNKITLKSFFKAKFLLFFYSIVILSIINIPIIIITGGNIIIYMSFMLFNIGIMPLIILSISFYNNERASLDRGIYLNYEGYGMWQYLLFVLELLLPVLLYQNLNKLMTPFYSLLILSLIGIIGIIFFVINPCLFFNKRKYLIINGFNKK